MSAAPPPPLRHHAELNATPMLDVLLVLLVVFMLVAMRLRHTIDAQLPLSCASVGASCEGRGDDIVLEVLPGPAYLLNHEPVPRGALRARLTEVYAGRPSKLIQVTGRAGASYQQVIDAMDAARGSGVRVIGLLPRDSTVSR